jgi:hypothetical protein
MDLAKVLTQLHKELDNLNATIATLERMQQGGRPPRRVPSQASRANQSTGKRAPRTERRRP